MSPRIEFEVDGVPPIKRGNQSMWGKQLDRVKALRWQAATKAKGVDAATIGDEVTLEVGVRARAEDGDLDGFVAGICDGLQPCNANYLPYVSDDEWADLPPEAHPSRPIGLADDRSVTSIRAVRRAPEADRGYSVLLTW